jgi:hypothetical protein
LELRLKLLPSVTTTEVGWGSIYMAPATETVRMALLDTREVPRPSVRWQEKTEPVSARVVTGVT